MPAARISRRSSAFTFSRLAFSSRTWSPFLRASFPPTREPTNPIAWPAINAPTRYLWSTSKPANFTVKSSRKISSGSVSSEERGSAERSGADDAV